MGTVIQFGIKTHPRKVSVNNYKTIYRRSLNNIIHPTCTHANRKVRILILTLQFYNSSTHKFIRLESQLQGRGALAFPINFPGDACAFSNLRTTDGGRNLGFPLELRGELYKITMPVNSISRESDIIVQEDGLCVWIFKRIRIAFQVIPAFNQG